jgi:hypothetical protein
MLRPCGIPSPCVLIILEKSRPLPFEMKVQNITNVIAGASFNHPICIAVNMNILFEEYCLEE